MIISELLLEQAINNVKSSGDYEIGGEHYKRVPKGYDHNHIRANYPEI